MFQINHGCFFLWQRALSSHPKAKHMKEHLCTLKASLVALALAALLPTAPAPAQQLGISASNYAGTNSLYSNPSFIADSRHGFFLSLFSTEAGATNNYLRFDGPSSLFRMVRAGEEFETDYIKENLNGKAKLVTAGAEFRGPALMLSLSPRHSIAFTTRVRSGVQANNLSEDIARLYKVVEDDDESFLNKAFQSQSMNLNANVFSELGLTYARVLADRGPHFVKGGITVKKLTGGYSAFLSINDTGFTVREGQQTGSEDADYILHLDRVQARYGYAAAEDFDALEPSDAIRLLTGADAPGKGWGADIGFAYEYRPDPAQYRYTMDGKSEFDVEENKYKYRLAIAVMDVGGISYADAPSVQAYSISRTARELNLNTLGEAEDTDEAIGILNQSLDAAAADRSTSFRSGLPTALNVSFDYNIAGALYANASLVQGLRGKDAVGMRQSSLAALTPRLELRKLEIAFPVALQNNYSVVTVGAMVRLLNFYVGSDNLGGAFNIGNPYGANVYAGVSLLPLLRRNIKDKDGDGVSNKRDKCRKTPGKAEFMGCPDAAHTQHL